MIALFLESYFIPNMMFIPFESITNRFATKGISLMITDALVTHWLTRTLAPGASMTYGVGVVLTFSPCHQT